MHSNLDLRNSIEKLGSIEQSNDIGHRDILENKNV